MKGINSHKANLAAAGAGDKYESINMSWLKRM